MGSNKLWVVGGTILAILLIAAGWKILNKAGDKGWKILIPIYGSYCLYKVADSEGIFLGTIAVSVATSVITSIITSSQRNTYAYSFSRPNQTGVMIVTVIGAIIMLILQIKYVSRMAKAFGKSTGFAVGLFFLNAIFMMILGFGSAQHYRNPSYQSATQK